MRMFNEDDQLEIKNIGPAYENGIARVRQLHIVVGFIKKQRTRA
jgi:hypothetical protein